MPAGFPGRNEKGEIFGTGPNKTRLANLELQVDEIQLRVPALSFLT